MCEKRDTLIMRTVNGHREYVCDAECIGGKVLFYWTRFRLFASRYRRCDAEILVDWVADETYPGPPAMEHWEVVAS